MALVFTLSFISVFLLALALMTIPVASRSRVRRSLGRLDAYDLAGNEAGNEESPFMDRIIWPMLDSISRAVRQRTGDERIEGLRHKLGLAGVRNISAEKFMSIRLGLTGVGLVVYLVVVLPWLIISGRPLWLGLPIVAAGFFLPELWLQRHIDSRQRQIGATLADAIDILTIGIEAGLAFDSALAKVAKSVDGPIGEEFGRTLGELQIGVSRREALRNLGDRTIVPELQNFCATLVQADTLGISISKILRTEATELRDRRRQAAEEQALKTPVKLVFPIVLCILPALMIIIIGPGILRIAGSLFKMM